MLWTPATLPAFQDDRPDALTSEASMLTCCAVVMIDGQVVHQPGCPQQHREIRECALCGSDFEPESAAQECCDEDCATAYHAN